MNLRRLAFLLAAPVTLLLLMACGAESIRTQVPGLATAVPIPIPGLAVDPAPTTTPQESAVPLATPGPAAIEHAAGPKSAETQPAGGQSQVPTNVFYQQNGLILEYYWPLDEPDNLSTQETQILAYNESGETIEFKSVTISFVEGGAARAQTSGTWERFPSRVRWDRNEYISIPPSRYEGEPLRLLPGEKAKLQWYLEGVSGIDAGQSVAIDLTVVGERGTLSIKETLVRGARQTQIPPAAIPVPTQRPPATPTPASHDAPVAASESGVRWMFNGVEWSPNGEAPNCDDPFVLQTPVDMSIVTSALWPGQQRGAYVAHGGFRFDGNADNNVTVRAPVGSHLVQAAKYLESGVPQYLLFFSVPCGFFYRFDHVLEVPPELAEALKDIPPANSGDSRTSFINPPFWVDQGDVVGTAVGIPPANIFVDFGLYDVRKPNNVVPNPAWADLFASDKEFGHYGVCFFDYLPAADGEKMRSLPTGKEGATSDFCE
ncbi:MAG: hypothetical protein O3A93_05110 [Chloroflexi bacterium]|nr:hypothetical protein [Chloroflexota bacterium]MDA1270621.1 hypothetical protein [Chloroflexota bacterium]